MKRILALVLVALMALATLTACSGGANNGSAGGTDWPKGTVSGFFPLVVGIAMAALSVLRLILALREKKGEAKKSGDDLMGGLSTIILIAGYCIAFSPVGFIISSIIYLFLQILVLTPKEKRNWLVMYGVSLSSVKRWDKRYDGKDWRSLKEGSHRPHGHPRQHTEAEEMQISKAFWKKYERYG
ncbi:MAG: tripartite tricarboxylate transporter TctB family protein, partial [Clostridia bacterium]|nr:tripartite tricarboxylate transporter TctB family protein [Clostridia bacterium]